MINHGVTPTGLGGKRETTTVWAEASAAPLARILIADDRSLTREGMRTLLAGEPDLEVIAEAGNGQEALELSCLHHPDLVLMDVWMPEMDGLEATRKIKEECPTTSILIVTRHENQDYLLKAIRAGAEGYVLKNTPKNELLDAVRRVLRGGSTLDHELAARLLKRLATGEADWRRTEPFPSPPPPEPTAKGSQGPLLPGPGYLTPRELEVLRLVAKGKRDRQIAQELVVSVTTAKTHVRNIIAKLKVSDRTQAAVRAVELGLFSEQEKEG